MWYSFYMKNLSHTISAVLIVSMVLVMTPAEAFAQTLNYQPQTQAERIAYLYGRIAQLLQIKQLLDQGKSWNEAVALAQVNYVTIQTHKALEVEATTAILRGEVNLYGKATAQAWFEYGLDDDFLDQRTGKVTIRSAYERAVRVGLRNLKPDERYYFRLVTSDSNGIVTYGDIYAFRTDELE